MYPAATISNVTLQIPVGRVSIPNRLPVSTNDAKSAMIIPCSSNALPLTPHFKNHMTAHMIPHKPSPTHLSNKEPQCFSPQTQYLPVPMATPPPALLCSAPLLRKPTTQ